MKYYQLELMLYVFRVLSQDHLIYLVDIWSHIVCAPQLCAPYTDSTG